jgi:hypothetical protein
MLRLRQILRYAVGSLLLFASIEAAVFHSGLYLSIVEPASSAGMVETLTRNERNRAVDDRNRVLAVGDSRMGILPRMANERNVGYRYAAVVIGVDDYDLRDVPDVFQERISDLNYLAGRLRVSDLAEFSESSRGRVRS